MIIENTKENQHVPSAVKNKHTCGHGLVGRDASHGDSVSRTSLYGKSGKELTSHRGIFKIQLSPS